MKLARRVPPLRLRHLAIAAIFALGFVTGVAPLGNYDWGWHVAGGRFIVEHGRVPHSDPFSFTMRGQEWVMHEWAWDVLLYLLYHGFGPLGVIYLKAVVAGAIAVAMFWLMMRRGASLTLAMAVAAVATRAAQPWVNERPQVAHTLFVLLAFHLMQSYREGKPQRLLWYPVLMVVWVNFHGSFPLGLLFFGLFAVSELLIPAEGGLRAGVPRPWFLRPRRGPAEGEAADRPLPLELPGGNAAARAPTRPGPLAFILARPWLLFLLVLLISVGACCLGPNGVRGALYPLDYVGGRLDWATEVVLEFKSPDWHAGYIRWLEALMLVTYGLLAVSPRAPALFDLVTVLLGTGMVLKWGRNGALFIILAAPVVAVHLTAWVERAVLLGHSLDEDLRAFLAPRRVLLRAPCWLALVALGAWMALSLPPGRVDKAFSLGQLPVKAAEVIAANDLKGNMFNVYHWGGYLVWRFYLQRPVFIDGRADVFGKAMWDDYRAVSNGGENWHQVLDKHKVQYLLAESTWTFLRTLDLSPDFTCIYHDSLASLYVRNDGPNAEVLRRFKAKKLKVPGDKQPNRQAILW